MRPSVLSLLLSVGGLASLAGCSHFVETRAVDAFTEALAAEDADELRTATSSTFAGKALRSAEALDSLKILRLPTGDTSVVDVEDVSDTEKSVKVKVGDSKKVLLYKLVKDDERDWVVDDVYVRQSRRGHTDTRSVTEQMDLLLSVREFLGAWGGGSRNDVIGVTTPLLGQVLGELPPAYLADLVQRVAGSIDPERPVRPEAQLDGDMALVALPRSTGKLLLTFRQTQSGWLVNDLALQSRREEESVPSVLKLASATLAGVQFLEAYGAGDKRELATVSTPSFFRRVLEPADLTTLPLPTGAVPAPGFETRMQAHRADFVLPAETEVVKLSLVREATDAVREQAPVFRVEEATLYALDGSSERRLSAVFTAHASMQVFADALVQGDLGLLRQSATTDFNDRVWDRLVDVGLENFPIVDVDAASPRVLSTVFRGAVVEITVSQGSRAMTYVLRERDAELRVDDVLVPAEGRPESLKTTLELLVPVHQFAVGVRSGDVGLLQRSSSDDFNRLVWNQTREPSSRTHVAAKHLRELPSKVEPTANGATILLGSERYGARVALVEERGLPVVDDVLLIAGPEPHQRAELKRTLRSEIGTTISEATPPSGVRRVSGTSESAPPRRLSPRAAERVPQSEREGFAAPVPLTDDLGDMPLP